MCRKKSLVTRQSKPSLVRELLQFMLRLLHSQGLRETRTHSRCDFIDTLVLLHGEAFQGLRRPPVDVDTTCIAMGTPQTFL